MFCNSPGTDTRIWDAVIGELEPDYQLVTYDKRGHCLTSVLRRPYSIADLAADLLELVDTPAVLCRPPTARRLIVDSPTRVTSVRLSFSMKLMTPCLR